MRKAVHEILDVQSGPLFYNLEPKLEARKSSSEYQKSSKNRLTSKERVDLVFKYFNVVLTDQKKWIEKFNKNSTVASKLRQGGNDLYKKKDFGGALEWYNVAIMFAPGGDQELGLAFANRFIVLIKLGHPEEALEDIDLALLNNYPKPLVLESRRKKCMEIIDQRKSRYNEERYLRIKVDVEQGKRQKMREEMLQIKNPNPRIPDAANFVAIEYDEAIGRKLVVTQDIPAGTALMVDDPYVTVLNKTEGWESDHCHHCLKRIRRGIPCENCVFAIYCNESCRQEAHGEYHKFECPCMDYLHVEEQPSIVAFRIVCKAGPKKLLELYQSQDPSFFNPKKPYGVEEGCKFNEDPYEAVYHMMAHSGKLKEAEQVNSTKTISAIVLALILESRSAFFRQIPKRQRADFTKFVSTLIRHHMDSVNVNPTPVFEMRGLEEVSWTDFYTEGSDSESLAWKIKLCNLVDFALGVYPLASLKNHSCDPNVIYVHEPIKGRKFAIASRALKAGDMISGSYGVTYTEHPLEYRQERLKNKFHFTCRCVACVNHWPTMGQSLMKGPFGVHQFCCPTCSVQYSTMEKTSAEFKKKCGLKEAGSWKCSSCGQQYSGNTLQLLQTLNVMVLEAAAQLRQSNRPREAIQKLLEAIDYFQTYLVPPSHFLTLTELAFFKTLALVFDSLNWSVFGEN